MRIRMLMGMIGWSNDDGMTNAAEPKGNWTVIIYDQLLEIATFTNALKFASTRTGH